MCAQRSELTVRGEDDDGVPGRELVNRSLVCGASKVSFASRVVEPHSELTSFRVDLALLGETLEAERSH